MSVFDEMGKYWAEIADQSHTDRQLAFIKKILGPTCLILDLACGAGRHLIGLGKIGYRVIGLDISVNLLKIAKSRWHEAEVVRGDMRFLPFKPSAFDAVVSMDQSFGYLPSEQDDLQSFRAISNALHRDGILIVDVFNRMHLVRQLRANVQLKSTKYPSFLLIQKRNIDFDSGKLLDHWTIHDSTDGKMRVFEHVTRLYTRDGLQNMLETAGFIIKAVYGEYDEQSYTENSHRLIIIANSK